MDTKRKKLFEARDFHIHGTEHQAVVIGWNFVKCKECGRHAHLDRKSGILILHTRGAKVENKGIAVGHRVTMREISASEL